MTTCSRSFLVVGIAVCLLAPVACTPCGLLERTPPSRLETLHPLEPSLELALALETKVGEVSQVSPGALFQLHLTENELTSYVAFRLTGLSLKDPKIRISEGKLHASATTTEPIKADLAATCVLRPAQTGLEILIEDVTVGDVQLPGFVVKSLTTHANEVISQARLDIDITDVRMRGGELIITGTRGS